MATGTDKQKKLHYELSHVGLRAQATAVGLLQLCHELRRVNVIDEAAIDRIVDAHLVHGEEVTDLVFHRLGTGDTEPHDG